MKYPCIICGNKRAVMREEIGCEFLCLKCMKLYMRKYAKAYYGKK